LAQLLREHLRKHRLAIGKAVKETRELADESRAIGDRLDAEAGGERRPPPWDRDVFGNCRGRSEM
jgi:hypothetical protein